MTKGFAAFLVAMMALTPALVAAQTGSGSGSGAAGGSGSGAPSGTSGAAGSGGTTSGGGTSGSGASPSASPSPSSSSTSGDFSQYTTQADCEKAGGMWETAANKCAKK